LATHVERTLSKDLTFQYNNILYQLETDTPNRLRYKKVSIILREGRGLIAEYQGNEMKYTTWEDIDYKGPRVVGSKELENKWKRKSA